MTPSNIYSSQQRTVKLLKKLGKATIHIMEATKQLKPCAWKKNTHNTATWRVVHAVHKGTTWKSFRYHTVKNIVTTENPAISEQAF